MMTHPETTKTVTDVLSIGTVLGTIVGVLPAIAALMSIVWTGIRIYEWSKNRGNKQFD